MRIPRSRTVLFLYARWTTGSGYEMLITGPGIGLEIATAHGRALIKYGEGQPGARRLPAGNGTWLKIGEYDGRVYDWPDVEAEFLTETMERFIEDREAPPL